MSVSISSFLVFPIPSSNSCGSKFHFVFSRFPLPSSSWHSEFHPHSQGFEYDPFGIGVKSSIPFFLGFQVPFVLGCRIPFPFFFFFFFGIPISFSLFFRFQVASPCAWGFVFHDIVLSWVLCPCYRASNPFPSIFIVLISTLLFLWLSSIYLFKRSQVPSPCSRVSNSILLVSGF